MSARPFETHNYAANAALPPPAFNLKPIFKLQTSGGEMTRAARFARSAGAAMSALKIKYKDPNHLRPRVKNPRTHTAKQIRQVAASFKEFGFINPILTDSADGIIAGHARVEAAKLIGMSDVPTVRVDHLTPAQIRAFVIADNRLAEVAGWDRELLALELQALSIELNFDVTVTGFETAEVDLLISELNEGTPDEADEIPEIDRSVPAVSRPGDRWRIGDHFLLCGDALSKNSYVDLLGAQKAQMVFTDPPYNLAITGNVSGLGKVKHREFAMASGEMSPHEYTKFLGAAFMHLADSSTNGSIHFICIDWRHIRELLQAAAKPYSELKNVCVWAKTNAGMGSLYRSQHELVFVFKKGTAPHVNNVELGRFGRNRTNIWNYPGTNIVGKNRDAEIALHPTIKPLALVADAILDCSQRGGIILDVFAGSGTTLIAAEKTGRRGFGIEIDPYYGDTIIRRFDEMYGLKAIHEQSKLDFATLCIQRSPQERQNGKEANEGKRQRQKVGRGNPPKHTQFRKGQSGNKKGRPKGSKNLSTYIMEAARDHVTATVGGRTRTISKIQATAMQLATKAAGGDQAAMGRFLDWVDEIETRAASVKPTQFPLSAPDIEVIRAAYERMKQCQPEKPEE